MSKLYHCISVVPCNVPVFFENTTENFPSNCFLSNAGPWQIVAYGGLSFKSLGFSHSTLPNGGCNYGSKCLSNDSFFFLLKRVNILTRMPSRPQELCVAGLLGREAGECWSSLRKEADFLKGAGAERGRASSSNPCSPCAGSGTFLRQHPWPLWALVSPALRWQVQKRSLPGKSFLNRPWVCKANRHPRHLLSLRLSGTGEHPTASLWRPRAPCSGAHQRPWGIRWRQIRSSVSCLKFLHVLPCPNHNLMARTTTANPFSCSASDLVALHVPSRL